MILARARKTRGARKSVQQPGWLVFEGSFAARPCTVIDLSDRGAKVEAGDLARSGQACLALSRDVRTGRPCEVVWQRGKTFGVKFV